MSVHIDQHMETEDSLKELMRKNAAHEEKNWPFGEYDPLTFKRFGYIELFGQGCHIVAEANFEVMKAYFKHELAHGIMDISLTTEDYMCGQGRLVCIWVMMERYNHRITTKAWDKFYGMMEKLDDYMYFSYSDKTIPGGRRSAEDLSSNMEYEATLANIASEGKRVLNNLVLVSDEEPGPNVWASDVYHWLSEVMPGEVENRDDQGGWPSDYALMKAFEALNYLDPNTEHLFGCTDYTSKKYDWLVKRLSDGLPMFHSRRIFSLNGLLADDQYFAGRA